MVDRGGGGVFRIYAILMLFRITFSKVINSPPIKKLKTFLCPEVTKPIETNDVQLETGIVKHCLGAKIVDVPTLYMVHCACL